MRIALRLYYWSRTWLYARLPKIFPAPPALIPFGDGRYWFLMRDFSWVAGNGLPAVTVPEGFVTDLASTPNIVWPWMPPWAHYGNAAIIHDWLYWDQSGSRADADRFLLKASLWMGTPKWKARLMYIAVRWFGGAAWKANAMMKAAGVIRFVTEPLASGRETYAGYLARVQDPEVELRLQEARRATHWYRRIWIRVCRLLRKEEKDSGGSSDGDK